MARKKTGFYHHSTNVHGCYFLPKQFHECNHGKMTYGKQHDSGRIELNPLVETQVKIPAGYHIEKFNGIKHHYNISTGKCEYTKTRYSIIINNQENQNRPPRKY